MRDGSSPFIYHILLTLNWEPGPQTVLPGGRAWDSCFHVTVLLMGLLRHLTSLLQCEYHGNLPFWL